MPYISGYIKRVQTFAKVFKLSICDCKSKDEEDLLLFRYEYNLYYNNYLKSLDETEKGIINHIPFFNIGLKINTFCEPFENTLSIKSFYIEYDDNHKEWVKELQQWLNKNVVSTIKTPKVNANKHLNLETNEIIKAKHILIDFENIDTSDKKQQSIIFRLILNFHEYLYKMYEFKNTYRDKNEIKEYDMNKVIEHLELKNIHHFQKNPFILIHQLDFQVLDKFAVTMDIKEIIRLTYNSVSIILSSMATNGHTCIPIKNMLHAFPKQKEDEIKQILFQPDSSIFHIFEEKDVYIKDVWDKETIIVEKLKQFINITHNGIKNNYETIDHHISTFESNYKILFHCKQIKAIKSIFEIQAGLNILTGFPGSGKTFVINCITYCAKQLGLQVQLCAPTGKAAQKLGYNGNNGSTIHRTLETLYDERYDCFRFQKNAKNEIDTDLLIVDESSMIDFEMFYHLLNACRDNIKILFVGDENQLPSIKYGNILQSLIRSKLIPHTRLSHIYRQANGSKISILSKYIVKGEIPTINTINDQTETHMINLDYPKDILTCVTDIYTKGIENTTIISPMKKGKLGTTSINDYIHNKIYDSPRYQEDEKVLITYNTYVKNKAGEIDYNLSSFNGDVAKFVDYHNNDNVCITKDNHKQINIDIKNIDFGHACTVHKMQGSEKNTIILVVHSSHDCMLNRQLLYTAVTRSKSKLYIVGQDRAVINAIQTEAPIRNENLSKRIASCFSIT